MQRISAPVSNRADDHPRRFGYARFRGLTAFGKVAVLTMMLVAAAGVTLFVRELLELRSPPILRREVRSHLAAQDYEAARRALDLLAAATPGGLSDHDRMDLYVPVQDGLERLRRDYVREIDDHRRARRYEAALAGLRRMKGAGLAPDWVAYTQAQVLHAAGLPEEAAAAYLRCADSFPSSPLADDALFWAGIAFRAFHRPLEARAAWLRLVRSYPSSIWIGKAEAALRASDGEGSTSSP
jgi:hypothetical protein